jgi:hypothetical protein
VAVAVAIHIDEISEGHDCHQESAQACLQKLV